MTPSTLSYLLRLAISDRDELAARMIDGDLAPAWGEAAVAVRELLEMATAGSAKETENGPIR